jgi:hypothetical protein
MLAFSLLAGCGSDEAERGEGTVEVAVYGEAFIEEGIPASEVADGWAVQFSRFEVSLRDLSIAGGPLEDPSPMDLALASGGLGHLVAARAAPAGKHDDATFTIAALHVVGEANNGDTRKTFDWTFEQPVRYDRCETSTRVEPGKTATFQITVHADHFLYDSLVSEEPTLAFQRFADADSNENGEIERAELWETGIGSLDVGNADEITNLWEWLEALVPTLGHANGEHHCHAALHE